MPILTTDVVALGAVASPALFGGNILAPRGDMTGPGSYDAAINALGITDLRYPGGSLSEYLFNLRDPDARQVVDPRDGTTTEFIPLSDVMAYSADTGRAVSIVIPTRDQLSNTRLDDNGDRMPAIDREVLTGFVRDVVGGVYGDGTVAAFEIGNEYWGSGEMSAAEYGRLAADMAQIVDGVLSDMVATHPQAAQIDVLVQVGTNFGYSDLAAQYEGMSTADILSDLEAAYGIELDQNGASPDWTEINNVILTSYFDEDALEATDGVIAHAYSRAPEVPHSRWFQIEQVEEHWQSIDPSLEIHVTEWNQKSNTQALEDTTDYGLWQAQEMLEQMEEFLRLGVDAAQVWPLIQNTDTALALGRSFDTPTVAGEMFSVMSETLVGMRMLDFTPSADNRDTEFETPELDVHAFGNGQDMVVYITSNLRDAATDSVVDISALIAGAGQVDVTVLGVAEGFAPGNTQSPALRETPPPEDVYDQGVVDAVLAPGEIMQLVLRDVTPTTEFAPTFAATAMAEAAVIPDLPDASAPPDLPDTSMPPPDAAELPEAQSAEPDDSAEIDSLTEEAADDDGGGLGGAWLAGLLPLLFLLGCAPL
ncbi:hypothetical protein [Sagittula sp. SSi028]|uniref:hypothetical protein n=1 Tax=Sagittula sp. SSi028 TaxID=3400636 RepID=UPI003AF80457